MAEVVNQVRTTDVQSNVRDDLARHVRDLSPVTEAMPYRLCDEAERDESLLPIHDVEAIIVTPVQDDSADSISPGVSESVDILDELGDVADRPLVGPLVVRNVQLPTQKIPDRDDLCSGRGPGAMAGAALVIPVPPMTDILPPPELSYQQGPCRLVGSTSCGLVLGARLGEAARYPLVRLACQSPARTSPTRHYAARKASKRSSSASSSGRDARGLGT